MPFQYPAPTMPGEVAQKVPTMADFNYLREIFNVVVPDGWVLTFQAAHRQNCTWAPGGGTGTFTQVNGIDPITSSNPLGPVTNVGINTFIASGVGHDRGAVPDPGAIAGTTKFLREDATWQVPPGGGASWTFKGEWTAIAYSTDDVVRHEDGLYKANAGTVGADVPGFDEFRRKKPILWMQDTVAYEETINLSSPQVFDSVLWGGANANTIQNAAIFAINLTNGGTLTFDFMVPVGTQLSDYTALLFESTLPNVGQQVAIYDGLMNPGPNTQFSAGLPIAFYFLVIYQRFNTLGGFPPSANVNVKVTASAGAVIGAAPTVKWDLLADNPDVPDFSGFFRGKLWEESFNTINLPSNTNVNWFDSSNVTLVLNAHTFFFDFTDPGDQTGDVPLKLTIVQGGGGVIDPGAWTSTTTTAAAIVDFDQIPTDLGTNVGDSLTVYFHYRSNIPTVGGATPSYIPMVWHNTGAPPAPASSFFWALVLGQ